MKKYFVYLFCIFFFSCYASDIALIAGLTAWDKVSNKLAKKNRFVFKNVTRKRRVQKVPVSSSRKRKTRDDYDRYDEYDEGYEEVPRKKVKKTSEAAYDHAYDAYDEAYQESLFDKDYDQNYEKQLKRYQDDEPPEEKSHKKSKSSNDDDALDIKKSKRISEYDSVEDDGYSANDNDINPDDYLDQNT